jgi:hypothetical protein
MTWFKENKFLSGLILITLLLAALIIFFGTNAGSQLEEVQSEITAKQSKQLAMKTLNPYPTPENAKVKEENLKAVLAKGNEAREKLLAFRPETMDEVTGAVFSENLSAAVDRVKALFPTEAGLPKSFNLGFSAYSGVSPKEGSTGVLTYQLGAMEHVFQELAAAGVTEVQNLSRVKLPAENGDDWPDAIGGKKGKDLRSNRPKKAIQGKGKGRAKSPFDELPPVAHRLPFELVFKAPEGPARKFLTKLANSEEYFFETRMARIVNPSPVPSAGKAATTAKPEENAFGADFEVEGAEPKPAVVSEQILNKVSGGDQLVIFLRADLLLFMDEQKFPELK